MNLRNVNNQEMMNMKDFKKIIYKFFEEHNNVYIYGAGIYAHYIEAVCNQWNLKIDGFITTEHEKDEYKGLPVYTILEIDKKKIDGIIPGFKGCKKELIYPEKIDWLDINPAIFKYFILENVIDSLEINKDISLMNNAWNKILIIRLDAIGDLVCTTPLFREIKQNYPKSEITLILQKSNKAIIEGNPYVDNIIEYDGVVYNEDMFDNSENVQNIVNDCKRFIEEKLDFNGYDYVILPMHLMVGRNAFFTIALAASVKSRKVMGWVLGNSKENLYLSDILSSVVDKVVINEKPNSESGYILEMLKSEGLKVTSYRPEIYCSNMDNKYKDMFKEEFLYVAVGIVGSQERKNWRTDNYNKLFETFKGKNIRFIIIGGDDAVESSMKVSNNSMVINLVKKTSLRDTIEVINRCAIYLGSNTGLMHIAAALGKPCVTLYAAMKGVSDWDGTGPYRWGVKNVPHIDLLADIGLDGCVGYCNKKYSHCINQISVEQVRKSIVKLLNISE